MIVLNFFILLLFSLNQAKALIEVDITRGNLNPSSSCFAFIF